MTRPIVELCIHGEAKPHWSNRFPLSERCPGGRVLEDMLDVLGLIATSWEGEHCNQCGKPYADVYSLPDELWARIHDRAPAGLLCPVCALERVGRVLEQAIIIERDTDGEWPGWAIMILRYEVAALAEASADEILDRLALVSAQQLDTFNGVQ